MIPPMEFLNLVYKYCMDNKSEIPEGWAVPDDLAKRINEVVNKKPITPENELQDALERWREILP